MEWWQTLLIALCPSILSTIVAIVVPIVQMKDSAKERKDKYEAEQKLHAYQRRFNMETEIYKEVYEKLMEMVSECLTLFEEADIDTARKQKDKSDFKNVYDNVCKAHNEANISINKYAIFIPDEWYKKFLRIKVLCRCEIRDFEKYIIQDQLEGKTSKDIIQESKNRTVEIARIYGELVDDLRKYLSEFGMQV